MSEKAIEIFGKMWISQKRADVPEYVYKELLRHDLPNGYYLTMFEFGEWFGDVGGKAYQIALCRVVKDAQKQFGELENSPYIIVERNELVKSEIWTREVNEKTSVGENYARIYADDLEGFNEVYVKCLKIANG